ncbi:hypothetical protein DB346_14990 [Verrucomicrobia bacterium LW23]|nr:hypothetical protein DB346_14990 [Verrucomicrobia bacterium LW23]
MTTSAPPSPWLSRVRIAAAVALVAFFLAALSCANLLAIGKAKAGLSAAIESGDIFHHVSPVFAFVGGSTRAELSAFQGCDYTIRILPFDWVGDGRASHTAFVRSGDRELRVRLLLSVAGRCHIVGFTVAKAGSPQSKTAARAGAP